jgi:hypothetical protein
MSKIFGRIHFPWILAVAVSLIMVIILGAVPLFASGSGYISGTVTDKDQNKIINVLIEVINPLTSEVIASGTTDSNAAYIISLIPEGTYNIKVTPTSESGYSS